jgi:DNA-binding NarL/FixJ family response regulator
MMSQPRLAILIISCHPLLGEGIGRLLAAEEGMRVSHAACSQPERVDAALGTGPDVVVVERCSGCDARQVLARVPNALVFDIGIEPGPTWVYRRQEIPGDPHAIVQLVRLLRRGHPDISLGEERTHPETLVPAGP